jgi:hypothetical protein
MGSRESLQPLDALALRHLVELDAGCGGYACHGVRGWALREDVERAIRRSLTERLPKLHARGLLDRADVRAPHQPSAVYGYRVTARCLALLARLEGITPHPLAPARTLAPGEREPAVYIPPRSLAALNQLRRAACDPRCLHFGEPGWRTMRQLEAQANPPKPPPPEWSDGYNWRGPFDGVVGEDWKPEEWGGAFEEDQELDVPFDRYPPWPRRLLNDPRDWRTDEDDAEDRNLPPWVPKRWRRQPTGHDDEPERVGFWSTDIDWLVRPGYALRSAVTHPAGGRSIVVWRVTPEGVAALALDWREPEL